MLYNIYIISNNSTNFGFKSNVTPPQNEKLNPFENRLYDMVQSIEFKSVRINFQSTLRDDLNKIKSSRNLLYSCLLIKQRACMKCRRINTKRY